MEVLNIALRRKSEAGEAARFVYAAERGWMRYALAGAHVALGGAAGCRTAAPAHPAKLHRSRLARGAPSSIHPRNRPWRKRDTQGRVNGPNTERGHSLGRAQSCGGTRTSGPAPGGRVEPRCLQRPIGHSHRSRPEQPGAARWLPARARDHLCKITEAVVGEDQCRSAPSPPNV